MAPGLTSVPVSNGIAEPLSQKLAKRAKNSDDSPLYPDYMRKSYSY